jgi:nucleoside-diphosphate-sugar epimerase
MDRSLDASSNVLITGVTGLIGGEVFRHLARVTRGTIWPLIRPQAESGPTARLVRRLRRSGDRSRIAPNVRGLAGDILESDWALDQADLGEVERDVDVIIHIAAETSFSPEKEVARTNVTGVEHLIRLAKRCRRTPLVVYMSTASNVGDVTGACLDEDQGCRPDNHHHNEYTQSKATAERMLRESGLPTLTLRPTVVLSAGLPDPKFARQILWIAPATRFFDALPLDPASRLDIVDIEYVARAALALMAAPRRRHDCYHLSAGEDRSISVGRLSSLVDRHLGREEPLELVRPSEWTRADTRRNVRTALQRKLFKSIRYYLPFANMDVVYDNARLKAELGASAPAVRPVEFYLCDLLGTIRTSMAVREAALP